MSVLFVSDSIVEVVASVLQVIGIAVVALVITLLSLWVFWHIGWLMYGVYGFIWLFGGLIGIWAIAISGGNTLPGPALISNLSDPLGVFLGPALILLAILHGKSRWSMRHEFVLEQ